MSIGLDTSVVLRLLTYGFPAPQINQANLSPSGDWCGGNILLKSNANEGIVAGQFMENSQVTFELSVGWHHGESGGPIVRLDTCAAFSIMQRYRNIATPYGNVAGPHQGYSLASMESLLPATGMVFVSYIGLTKVASVAEEVRNPERNIPRGMMAALFSVMAIYALGVWVTVGVLPAKELHVSLTPLADAGRKILGPVGALLLCSAAILAFATTANAGLMAASRYLLAMGRDRVISHQFARLSRTKVPKNALYVTTVLVLLIVFVVDVEGIAKLASTFQLLAFALVNIAVIVMRESGMVSYDPGFRSPLYPYTQIAGVIVSVVLIPEMGLMSSLFAMGLVGLGVVWYHLYVRHRVPRVGAVAKVAERIAESLLRRDAQALGLDQELREILKEKGLRRGDPFAQMVHDAEFIEIAPRADCEGVLRQAATIIAERANLSGDLILGGLLQRSRLGETPAEAGIALPHLLLDEVEGFHFVIARSIQGIDFPMANQAIHAVFILLGNRKDPSQHLRFLAEIARRAEIPDFIDRWVDAESEKELRGLLLTALEKHP